MSEGVGGWLFLVVNVIFVVVLAAGLIYGSLMWRSWRKRPEAAAERDAKTRELFKGDTSSEDLRHDKHAER